MNYNFENYLANKLLRIAVELDFKDENGNADPVNIEISEEQNFAKMDNLTPNTIYIVIKYLSSDIQYYTETTPIQILVLSEQNSLDKAKMIMNKFANDNNWQIIQENGTYIKQQYNSPVILNNYVEVAYGYRSVLYVTGTLYIMENVVDVKNVSIDGNDVKPLAFNMAYSMSTNTQQLANKYIATSLKTVSTLSISITVPMIESELITKVMNIINETTNYDGNNDFVIRFDCGLKTVTGQGDILPKYIVKTMRLISAQITSAPNQVPGIQLGFME